MVGLHLFEMELASFLGASAVRADTLLPGIRLSFHLLRERAQAEGSLVTDELYIRLGAGCPAPAKVTGCEA